MSIFEFHDHEIDVDAIMATIRNRIDSRAKDTVSSGSAHIRPDEEPLPKPFRHLDDPIRMALNEADRMKVVYQLSLDEPSRAKRTVKRLARGLIDTPFFRFLTIKQVVVNQALINAINCLHEKAQALDACVIKANETREQIFRHKERLDGLERTVEDKHRDLYGRVAHHNERLGAVEKASEERYLDLDERVAGHIERLGALEKASEDRHLDLDERVATHNERLGALEKTSEDRHLDLDERVATHNDRLGALEKTSEDRHLDLDERVATHNERLGALEKTSEERHLDLDERVATHDKLLETLEKEGEGRHAEFLERLADNDDRQEVAIRTLKLIEREQQNIKRRLELFIRQLRAEQILEPISVEDKEESSDLALALLLEQFRGPQQMIRTRQEIYIPLINTLSESLKELPILDLGSGRGEFIELLQQHGFQAKGYDSNEFLVKECQERGLPISYGDAFDVLKELEDESVSAITALQIIEHFERPLIWEFIRLCFEKLVPEGLFIIETINPESLTSAIITFNKDFTHTQLLHPDTIQFLMEREGFKDIETHYLHPHKDTDTLQLIPESAVSSPHVDIINRNIRRLNEVLFGYRDYAILARK
jgi:O-antigen chain-terminating methyltransferase